MTRQCFECDHRWLATPAQPMCPKCGGSGEELPEPPDALALPSSPRLA